MIIEGFAVGSTTLVGNLIKAFPSKRGNCFSMETKHGYKRIVNMNYENLMHLIQNNVITLPIKLDTISEKHALVCDDRVPCNYLTEDYCTICTPHNLLPESQRIRIKQKEKEDIESGKLTITEHIAEDGTTYKIHRMKIN